MRDKLKEHPKVAALLASGIIVLSAGALYTYWPRTPPPMPQTIEDVQTLFASDEYARLSTQERQPYQERSREIMRETGWEERRNLMSNEETSGAMQQAMIEGFERRMQETAVRAREYALADAAGRQRIIQEDLARGGGGWGRARGGEGGGDRGGEGRGGGDGQRGGERGGEGEGQGPSEEQRAQFRAQIEERIEAWINEGNGQDQALMREYRDAMRQAREQSQ